MEETTTCLCRICLREIVETEQYFFLNNDNELMLQSKLKDFLPEIDLSITLNPVACNNCMITIKQIYEFKQLCIQTETTLKNLQQQGTIKKESLHDNIKIEQSDLAIINDGGLAINMEDPVCVDVLSKTETTSMYLQSQGPVKEEFFDDNVKIERLDLPINNDGCFATNMDGPACIEQLLKTEANLRNLQGTIKTESFDDNIKVEVSDLPIINETETLRKLRQEGAIKKEFFGNNIEVEVSDLPITNSGSLAINMDGPVSIDEPSKTQLYYCYNCDFNTNKKTILIRHLIHRNLKTQMCKDTHKNCNYNTLFHTSSTNHKRKTTGKKPFKCNMCNYCSNVKANLKVHILTHTGEKPFKCHICNYTSKYKANLQVHIRTHTGEKPFKCNLCNFCSNQMFSLKRHICKHTGEKPFQCNRCDYCTTNMENLKNHMHKHTGDKPFKCNICDYSGITKAVLKSHMRKHTGDKPFKCNICNYCSASMGNVKTHMRKHTGEKPFKCSICNYSGITKSVLKTHMRKHTGEKPFKCNICDYSSSQSGCLKTHLRKHTGENLSV